MLDRILGITVAILESDAQRTHGVARGGFGSVASRSVASEKRCIGTTAHIPLLPVR